MNSDEHLDERLSRALRELPREAASPSFTADVLRRVRTRQAPKRRSAPGWVLAPAGAAFLLVAALLGWNEHVEEQERLAALARIEQIRAEKEDLAGQLDTLRRHLLADTQPVVYVGRAGDVDLVVDLEEIYKKTRAGRAPDVRPASGGADDQLQGAVYAW